MKAVAACLCGFETGLSVMRVLITASMKSVIIRGLLLPVDTSVGSTSLERKVSSVASSVLPADSHRVNVQTFERRTCRYIPTASSGQRMQCSTLVSYYHDLTSNHTMRLELLSSHQCPITYRG